MDSSATTRDIKIAALYRFCRLDAPEALRKLLAAYCCGRSIKGTLLIAREGINGTVAGSPTAIDALIAHLEAIPGMAGLEVKFSAASTMPFHRMKVRLKQEIVTMGVDGVDAASDAGAYVDAADWNSLIADPDTLVLDTRNDYEVELGAFRDAVDPRMTTFREFPDWVARNRPALEGRKIAMYCTGGIRCEKATAYVRSLGLPDIYHLKGGILKYLETVPAEESRWQGECFVFDERVSVTHGLAEGEATLCRACRRPLTGAGRQSPLFREGVSCDRCHGKRTDADRARYAERQRQVELAQTRGAVRHIGG